MSFSKVAACVVALTLPCAAFALENVKVKLTNADKPELLASLKAASLTKTLEADPGTPTRDVIAAARADYGRLVEALYAQGYYGAVVSITADGREVATIDPFNEPASINVVRIDVAPGRKFRFGTARISPQAPDTPPTEGFVSGEPALATVVRDAAQNVVTGWKRAGHAKAEITDQRIAARHADAFLDVELRTTPGPRVTFGQVSVSGESAVRDARIRQISGLPIGEQFSPAKVEKAAARLRKTGTFQSVQITEDETVQSDGGMGMDIAVVDRKPRRIGAGVELSSLDGLTLSGFWLHRNILGGAERFRVDGEVTQIGADSGVDYTLSFRFEKPAVYGPDTLFFAELDFSLLDEADYLEEKAALTLGVTREFSETLTGELGIGWARSRVTDRFATPQTTRELQLFSLPTALTWDLRDDPLDSKNGYYLRAEATPFYEAFRGDSGLHMGLDARAYRAFGEQNGTVLAGRLQLGSLLGPEAVDAPPQYLFYSGGGGTVRGQPYQSLGADHGGVSLGGRSFAALSGELRFDVTDALGVVAFADAGFVGADNFDNGNWHAGAGLGVRYKTPVGPIRFDVAAPVAGDTGDGFELYVGIGQAF